ncbi:hypothetical protein BGZ57DRAFT_911553 [Hyaloscypha finlandica]|nr:hypothetical protein BGZ57DRAFT_911553 [Hyaloscypha finlandica]
MNLSPEAVIALVTLFVTCTPPALLTLGWINRRRKRPAVHSVTDARLHRTSVPRPGTAIYVQHNAYPETRPRFGTPLILNHEAVSFYSQSRSYVQSLC